MIGTDEELTNPCDALTKHNRLCEDKGEQCWPSLLIPQLKENGIPNGRITPDEFDKELGKLKNWKEFVENVREKPMMRTM